LVLLSAGPKLGLGYVGRFFFFNPEKRMRAGAPRSFMKWYRTFLSNDIKIL